jgi:O-antigen/teichoic acid export membrane protein
MRHWKAVTTSAATLIARLSSTAALLVTNGIAAHLFSREQFGFWVLALVVNQLTNGFDLGFQFTLGNRLAALGSRGADGEQERRETFLSILFLQAGLFIVYSLIVLLAAPLIPWARWFKMTDPLLIRQVVPLMPLVIIIMIGTLPVGLIWTAFFAYREIKLASFLTGICNILQTVVFVVAARTCSFAWVIPIYYLSNIALGLMLTAYLFLRRKWRFTWIPVSRMVAIIRSMARVSSHAFLNTISAIISNVVGTIISGAGFGLAVAGDFDLMRRLFSFLATAHLAILAPISPAITQESRAGNWDSVRHRLRVCVLQVWPAFFLILGTGVWFMHPLLIHLWAGRTISNYSLAALLLAWACLSGFVNTFSSFLNSLGLVKIQAAAAIVMILPSILIPALLSRWMGVSGIALGFVLCSLPGAIILPLYARRALRLKLLRV